MKIKQLYSGDIYYSVDDPYKIYKKVHRHNEHLTYFWVWGQECINVHTTDHDEEVVLVNTVYNYEDHELLNYIFDGSGVVHSKEILGDLFWYLKENGLIYERFSDGFVLSDKGVEVKNNPPHVTSS